MGTDQMTVTQMDFLWRTEAPWIYAGTGEQSRLSTLPPLFYSKAELNVFVRRLRGWKMRGKQGLMDEFSAALQFFDGFGENWYALEDCLENLDDWWTADAYVLVIERAEELLVGDDVGLEGLLVSLQAAGRFWSQAVTSPEPYERMAVPFHVLLNVTDTDPEAVERVRRVAEGAGAALRL